MEISKNRTKKFLKNSFIGIISQIAIIFLTFVVRWFFIKYLGDNTLGVNGVFSSILSLLSVAELGFGATMLYSLYKPVANNDSEKINSIITYFGKIFNYIALTILVAGTIASCFLPYLLHGDYNYLTFIEYFIFLFSIVVTYPLDYKSVILTSHQKDYIKKRNNLIVSFCKSIVEIMVLCFFKNYLLYLIVALIANFSLNLINWYSAKKVYPQYFKRLYNLTDSEKKDIKDNVKALSFYRLFSVLINNVDNIYITIFVSTVVVGYYSNYNLVIMNLNSLIYIIISSLTVGVGDFLATEKCNTSREFLFNKINVLVFCVYGIISVCLFTMFDEFVYILGNYNSDCVLSIEVLVCIILNFLLPGLLNPVSSFRDSSGLFKKTKFCAVVFCALNIILSIIFGYFFGIFGILLATTISRIVTIFRYEPYIIYKSIFQKKPYSFYFNTIVKVSFCFAVGIGIKYINSLYFLNNILVDFITKCIVTLTISITIFVIALLINPFDRKIMLKYVHLIFNKKRNIE